MKVPSLFSTNSGSGHQGVLSKTKSWKTCNQPTASWFSCYQSGFPSYFPFPTKSAHSLLPDSSHISLIAFFASCPSARLSVIGRVHLSHSGGTPCSFFQGDLLQKTKESLRNNPNLQPMENFTTISLKLGSGICSLLGK